MTVQILSYDAHVMNMRARLPFKFGITTMTFTPHLFLRVELAVDGQRVEGMAADHLPPKWFTNNLNTAYGDDVAEMIRVIRHAAESAKGLGSAPGVYALWKRLYDAQSAWADRERIPPLLANFGVSLIERATIDAFCRAIGVPFGTALRENRFGIEEIPLELLPAGPVRTVTARHTVGMVDPIWDRDISASERVDDGLPQSLEKCVDAYGLRHFKIKLCGDVAKDLLRLRELAELIGKGSESSYSITLDGNENFREIGPFRELWGALRAEKALEPFLSRLMFVEQPLHRDVALSEGVKSAMLGWKDRPPIIIDESDAELSSLSMAIDCGYAGTSHKNCKGIFKGIANACRIAQLRRERPEGNWILSGEDLSVVGPISLLQDLAVMATLGIESVERNGHHYFRGLSVLPTDVQQTVLKHHGDVYRQHERGFPTLDIRRGAINIGSVVDAPFGEAFDFDPSRFTPLEEWKFQPM
jgi:L-alanine-DL-glutamate epimerase-like enolase superfamily enzyme